jgi:putative transposase
VHAELRLGLDIRVGRKRVARLLREHGLQGIHRRRRHDTTRRDPQAAPAPDLVERSCTPAGPDRLWVADIERHEAFPDRAVMKGHRRRPVAAGRLKLRAA